MLTHHHNLWSLVSTVSSATRKLMILKSGPNVSIYLTLILIIILQVNKINISINNANKILYAEILLMIILMLMWKRKMFLLSDDVNVTLYGKRIVIYKNIVDETINKIITIPQSITLVLITFKLKLIKIVTNILITIIIHNFLFLLKRRKNIKGKVVNYIYNFIKMKSKNNYISLIITQIKCKFAMVREFKSFFKIHLIVFINLGVLFKLSNIIVSSFSSFKLSLILYIQNSCRNFFCCNDKDWQLFSIHGEDLFSKIQNLSGIYLLYIEHILNLMVIESPNNIKVDTGKSIIKKLQVLRIITIYYLIRINRRLYLWYYHISNYDYSALNRFKTKCKNILTKIRLIIKEKRVDNIVNTKMFLFITTTIYVLFSYLKITRNLIMQFLIKEINIFRVLNIRLNNMVSTLDSCVGSWCMEQQTNWLYSSRLPIDLKIELQTLYMEDLQNDEILLCSRRDTIMETIKMIIEANKAIIHITKIVIVIVVLLIKQLFLILISVVRKKNGVKRTSIYKYIKLCVFILCLMNLPDLVVMAVYDEELAKHELNEEINENKFNLIFLMMLNGIKILLIVLLLIMLIRQKQKMIGNLMQERGYIKKFLKNNIITAMKNKNVARCGIQHTNTNINKRHMLNISYLNIQKHRIIYKKIIKSREIICLLNLFNCYSLMLHNEYLQFLEKEIQAIDKSRKERILGGMQTRLSTKWQMEKKQDVVKFISMKENRADENNEKSDRGKNISDENSEYKHPKVRKEKTKTKAKHAFRRLSFLERRNKKCSTTETTDEESADITDCNVIDSIKKQKEIKEEHMLNALTCQMYNKKDKDIGDIETEQQLKVINGKSAKAQKNIRDSLKCGIEEGGINNIQEESLLQVGTKQLNILTQSMIESSSQREMFKASFVNKTDLDFFRDNIVELLDTEIQILSAICIDRTYVFSGGIRIVTYQDRIPIRQIMSIKIGMKDNTSQNHYYDAHSMRILKDEHWLKIFSDVYRSWDTRSLLKILSNNQVAKSRFARVLDLDLIMYFGSYQIQTASGRKYKMTEVIKKVKNERIKWLVNQISKIKISSEKQIVKFVLTHYYGNDRIVEKLTLPMRLAKLTQVIAHQFKFKPNETMEAKIARVYRRIKKLPHIRNAIDGRKDMLNQLEEMKMTGKNNGKEIKMLRKLLKTDVPNNKAVINLLEQIDDFKDKSYFTSLKDYIMANSTISNLCLEDKQYRLESDEKLLDNFIQYLQAQTLAIYSMITQVVSRQGFRRVALILVDQSESPGLPYTLERIMELYGFTSISSENDDSDDAMQQREEKSYENENMQGRMQIFKSLAEMVNLDEQAKQKKFYGKMETKGNVTDIITTNNELVSGKKYDNNNKSEIIWGMEYYTTSIKKYINDDIEMTDKINTTSGNESGNVTEVLTGSQFNIATAEKNVSSLISIISLEEPVQMNLNNEAKYKDWTISQQRKKKKKKAKHFTNKPFTPEYEEEDEHSMDINENEKTLMQVGKPEKTMEILDRWQEEKIVDTDDEDQLDTHLYWEITNSEEKKDTLATITLPDLEKEEKIVPTENIFEQEQILVEGDEIGHFKYSMRDIEYVDETYDNSEMQKFKNINLTKENNKIVTVEDKNIVKLKIVDEEAESWKQFNAEIDTLIEADEQRREAEQNTNIKEQESKSGKTDEANKAGKKYKKHKILQVDTIKRKLAAVQRKIRSRASSHIIELCMNAHLLENLTIANPNYACKVITKHFLSTKQYDVKIEFDYEDMLAVAKAENTEEIESVVLKIMHKDYIEITEKIPPVMYNVTLNLLDYRKVIKILIYFKRYEEHIFGIFDSVISELKKKKFPVTFTYVFATLHFMVLLLIQPITYRIPKLDIELLSDIIWSFIHNTERVDQMTYATDLILHVMFYIKEYETRLTSLSGCDLYIKQGRMQALYIKQKVEMSFWNYGFIKMRFTVNCLLNDPNYNAKEMYIIYRLACDNGKQLFAGSLHPSAKKNLILHQAMYSLNDGEILALIKHLFDIMVNVAEIQMWRQITARLRFFNTLTHEFVGVDYNQVLRNYEFGINDIVNNEQLDKIFNCLLYQTSKIMIAHNLPKIASANTVRQARIYVDQIDRAQVSLESSIIKHNMRFGQFLLLKAITGILLMNKKAQNNNYVKTTIIKNKSEKYFDYEIHHNYTIEQIGSYKRMENPCDNTCYATRRCPLEEIALALAKTSYINLYRGISILKTVKIIGELVIINDKLWLTRSRKPMLAFTICTEKHAVCIDRMILQELKTVTAVIAHMAGVVGIKTEYKLLTKIRTRDTNFSTQNVIMVQFNSFDDKVGFLIEDRVKKKK